MAKNAGLNRAKKEKNDEFYTMFVDIEKELQHYSKHFLNKIVYCNCDDPSWSNFWLYFHLNYDRLGLKGLVSTHFTKDASSYKAEYHGGSDWNGLEWVETPFSGDGDFRSEECVEVLKAADIVVTNPPFSLFREFVAGLVEYQKLFLVIGNQNAITYKEVFPLIKQNKVWYGISIHSESVDFRMPDDYETYSPRTFLKGKHHYITLAGIRWFTNIDNDGRYKPLVLMTMKENQKFNKKIKENSNAYHKYDNYDVIECPTSDSIPSDYTGVMGVPITFMDRYDPDKFEIIGMAEDNGKGLSGKESKWDGKNPRCVINKKRMYKRLFIRNRLLNPTET